MQRKIALLVAERHKRPETGFLYSRDNTKAIKSHQNSINKLADTEAYVIDCIVDYTGENMLDKALKSERQMIKDKLLIKASDIGIGRDYIAKLFGMPKNSVSAQISHARTRETKRINRVANQ